MHNIKLLVKIITANYDRMRSYLKERIFLVEVPNRKTSHKTLRIFTKFAYYFRPDWTKSALCYIILK